MNISPTKTTLYLAITMALFLLIYTIQSPNSFIVFAQKIATFSLISENSQPVHLYFMGDMMFDRGVRRKVQTNGYDYVFGTATTTFAAHDLVIANLEGPITNWQSQTLFPDGTMSDQLVFTFPTSTAAALKKEGVTTVTLANNHEDNFGEEGIDETRHYLQEQGIQYFGDPNNAVDVATSTCIHGTCIGFVGYHEFSYKNEQNIIDAIQALRPHVQYLMVFPHWGVEYNTGFTSRQQQYAHMWIDAGADAVIGAHPHVIEPIEMYKGKPIFYSLGNFIFDQYFSFDTTHGLTLSVEVNSTSTTYHLIPIQNTNIHIQNMSTSTTASILQSLATLSSSTVDATTDAQIQNGMLTIPR